MYYNPVRDLFMVTLLSQYRVYAIRTYSATAVPRSFRAADGATVTHRSSSARFLKISHPQFDNVGFSMSV